ncbi:Spore protein SP21 [Aquicella siphonis]|uniref:Spore protein SP21 n=1 Tax=Aquicella siphonis TaxID=254247 RepID=A0A5E4PIZ5_9COXI|nr:Hsp20/alpha crystallin family protein [Aquicella siphonis]VVC76393.1 Spore protein SP21 [Aquicella siphonis]
MSIRYEPWNLINELNQALAAGGLQRILPRDDSKVESARWIPAVDIREEPGEFVLLIDVPGVEPEDIEVFMENNVLTIKGTRHDISKEEKRNYFRMERVKGEFYRRFTLPDTADAEQVSAKTRQGVLIVSIGKKKISQARKIEINTD